MTSQRTQLPLSILDSGTARTIFQEHVWSLFLTQWSSVALGQVIKFRHPELGILGGHLPATPDYPLVQPYPMLPAATRVFLVTCGLLPLCSLLETLLLPNGSPLQRPSPALGPRCTLAPPCSVTPVADVYCVTSRSRL